MMTERREKSNAREADGVHGEEGGLRKRNCETLQTYNESKQSDRTNEVGPVIR